MEYGYVLWILDPECNYGDAKTRPESPGNSPAWHDQHAGGPAGSPRRPRASSCLRRLDNPLQVLLCPSLVSALLGGHRPRSSVGKVFARPSPDVPSGKRQQSTANRLAKYLSHPLKIPLARVRTSWSKVLHRLPPTDIAVCLQSLDCLDPSPGLHGSSR